MTTFEELLEKLSAANVEYILVGGLAVDLCGFSRATMDVDVLVEASPDNLRRLLSSLSEFGEGSARELSEDDFPLEEGCVRIIEDFPIDVFTLMNGLKFNDLLAKTSVFVTERGIGIRYLTAAGLIELKKDSLRPKDRIDVSELRKLLGDD